MKQREVRFEVYQLRLRLIMDSLATLLAWFISYFLRFYILPGATKDSFGLFLELSALALFSTLLFLFYHRLYESRVVSSWAKEVNSLFKVSLDEFLLFVVFYYYIMDIWISRIALLLFFFILFLFLILGRRIANSLIGKKIRTGNFIQKVLVVGYGDRLEKYCRQTISEGETGRFKIIGQLHGKKSIDGLPQIEAAGLAEAVAGNDIDIVVMSFPDDTDPVKKDLIRQGLELLNAKVFILPEIPMSYAGSTITDFRSIPAVRLNSSELSLGKRFVKRAFDIVSCSIAVVLLSPLYLFLALLVKLSSPGPVFFRQKRVTRDGKVFDMLKFRSMRTDMPEQNGPHWTEENDPRVTKIGRLLRKTSLDEIPQFFNVLSGSMSLIGPRPERPELVEEFKKTINGYDIRHKMKAGISGWAQVNGLRGNTSIEKRIAFDLYYVRNWTLGFDLKIVILTFFKGFINKNAY